MKSVILSLVTAFATSTASAACFNFNGQGPSSIGNAPFAASATRVCVNPTGGFGRSPHLAVTFSDRQGDLAIVSGPIQRVGRCAGYCNQLVLQGGNINGENANIAGAVLTIQTEQDSRLGIAQGVLEIQAGRGFAQKFIIVGER